MRRWYGPAVALVIFGFCAAPAVAQKGKTKTPFRDKGENKVTDPTTDDLPNIDKKSLSEVPSTEKKKKTEYLRVKFDKSGKVAKSMQTSITRFAAKKDGKVITVDLIGAVHIGDSRYYDSLNDEFENYDVVLYELVAPPEHRLQLKDLKGKKASSMVSLIQKIAAVLFEFEMQLDGVDYTPKNFVHADQSPKQLAESMKKRGETPMTLFMSMMADSMRQQNQAKNNPKKVKQMPKIDLPALISDPNGAVKVKRAFAQLLTMNLDMTSDPNSAMAKLLIEDRNKAALKVMVKQINAGKKKIAIFYGAAHMPDFEKRLKKMKMKQVSHRWVTAWDLGDTNRTKIEHYAKFGKVFELIRDYLK